MSNDQIVFDFSEPEDKVAARPAAANGGAGKDARPADKAATAAKGGKANGPRSKETSSSPKKPAPAPEKEGSAPADQAGGDDGGRHSSPGSGERSAPTDGPLRQLMNTNFLQFASYVILDRAIPHVSDGLKPVQRRILHSLQEKDDGKFVKVANIVGHTMQYHPHGDASIADALVSLANKSPLVETQGNFGNVFTGDRAAAPRYIECRLSPMARDEMFNKDLTEYVPSYDGRNREPVTLPAKIPLVLMMGAEGIAVGLATKILPHNFVELLEGEIDLLRKKPVTLYPDFAQGGIMDPADYDNGRGRVKVRAKVAIKASGRIVINEIPYGTTTDSLIASIEEAGRKGKIKLKSITDFTAEHVEIEVKLAAGADPKKAVDALYAFTECEVGINSRIICLLDRRPVELTVEEILRYNAEQLMANLERELTIERDRLLDQIHQKTLVQIFIEQRIYKRIEKCDSVEAIDAAVRSGLDKYKDKIKREVTAEDIEMLMAIRIRRISLFDINRNKSEIKDIKLRIKEIAGHLKSMKRYTIAYIREQLKKYGANNGRRTEIKAFSDVDVKALTIKDLTLCHDKDSCYVGSSVRGEALFECSSYDKIIMVWSDGRYMVTPPPTKQFVDTSMVYCAVVSRDRVMTVIYTSDASVHLKRFTFGGTIMNREYRCVPDGALIRYFSDDAPAELHLKYKKAKNLRVLEETVRPEDFAVKGVKARGNRVASKKLDTVRTRAPKTASEADA